MFCGKCGKQIADGIKFCPNCGEQIEQTDSRKLAEKSEKGKKKKTGIFIVIAFVMIIVLAVCLILGIKEKPIEDGRNEDGQQSEMNINSEDEQTEVDVTEEDKKAVLKSEECQYGTGDLDYRYEYDIHGNPLFYQYLDGSYLKVEYEYTANGLVETMIKTYTDDEGEQIVYENVFSYKYNEISKPVLCAQDIYVNGLYDSKSETTCQYDENGNNLEQSSITYDSDGEIIGKSTSVWNDKKEKWCVTYRYIVTNELYYTYNENGDLIHSEEYRLGEKYQISTYEYVYNGDGNIIEEIYVWHFANTPDEKYIHNIYYEYDTNGNLSVKYDYSDDGDLWRVTYYTYYE